MGYSGIFQFPTYTNHLLTALALLAIILVGISLVIIILEWFFPRQFDYKGKHVLITGGSQGIGFEVAKVYLKKGARVTIAARSMDKLRAAKVELDRVASSVVQGRLDGFNKDSSSALSEEIMSSSNAEVGDRVCIIAVDVGESFEAVQSKFAEAEGRFGGIDVLVNCAGTSVAAEFEHTAVEDYERMLRVNVLGSMYPTRYVLAGMKARGYGRLVFVSSQVAQAAIHGYGCYAASKWALRGMAEAIQMECKPYNIFVSVAYPPDTDTPGYKIEMETKPELTKAISESGAVFTAEEVAKDIVYYSTKGYFGISTGLDGWLLKQAHPGLTPVNCWSEAVQQLWVVGLARLIGIVVTKQWEWAVGNAAKAPKSTESCTGKEKI